ncbi:MAG: tetratricopeptide repeat protein [Phycisphaerae bacterium]|nr:tetratricopeptide repeat protein [Phycisphaerae bacterium]
MQKSQETAARPSIAAGAVLIPAGTVALIIFTLPWRSASPSGKGLFWIAVLTALAGLYLAARLLIGSSRGKSMVLLTAGALGVYAALFAGGSYLTRPGPSAASIVEGPEQKPSGPDQTDPESTAPVLVSPPQQRGEVAKKAKQANDRGVTLYSQRKYREAETALRLAVDLDPNIGRYHSNLAAALSRQKRHAEAEVSARKAVSLEPNSGSFHGRLGVVLSNQKKPKEAEAEYRTAIRLVPTDRQAHANLAGALLRQDRREEALEAGRKAIGLGSRDHWALKELGLLDKSGPAPPKEPEKKDGPPPEKKDGPGPKEEDGPEPEKEEEPGPKADRIPV